ncbi:hypothetical protein N7509_002011 [Penicillium cosmopolitanum]|uniref:Sialidase domain-containing protein n=1 Tax=Penicillium cosmopolitanum TaxID=1131564 RepID=A0A9W9W8C7_9EURO|nr:uncharacterized protein N7509_002011 [Penicillium cosmopolitanum]KAJ5408128.1 hypothetical protein N7509_002011 [Penicillium cosmopolitanum]
MIELQHAGDQNGKLLATWEHWYTKGKNSDEPNGLPGSFIIRESDDGGNTWTTLTTIIDPQSGPGHPCTRFWQPFLFEFPRRLGQYPEGTVILVGVLVTSDLSYVSFHLWRSLDHGQTWSTGQEWQRSGSFTLGIWEPFLYLDSGNRLVAVFSDERSYWSQALVTVISDDGGESWGKIEFAVASSNIHDRPGMATVARMDNGEYVLAYEYCVTADCQIYVKFSSDGSNCQSVYPIGNESQVSQTHRVVFTNSQHGRGQWIWSPAPWNVRAGYPTCNSNYSPNLLVRSNGKVRLTAPASEWSTTKCSERTGEAFIGVLPYQSGFAVDGQSGWINFGGHWSISGSEYVFAPVGDQNAIAVTGSTGWTQYTITSDVMITTPSGRVGLMTHVAASTAPRSNLLQGFTFTVSTGTPLGRMIITQEGTVSRILGSHPTPWSVESNKWYRLTLTYHPDLVLTVTVGMPPAHDEDEDEEVEASTSYNISIATSLNSSTDNEFEQGMAGLIGRDGGGRFRNVHIVAN